MLFIDVDDFGDFNDSRGHALGDFVISEVGQATKEQFRQIDMSYQYGGDEEVIRMRELPGTFAEAQAVVEQTTKLLRRRVARIKSGGKLLGIKVSIGAVLFESGETDLKRRLTEADHALYYAKETGRNKTCFFHEVDPCWLSQRLKAKVVPPPTEKAIGVAAKTMKSPA